MSFLSDWVRHQKHNLGQLLWDRKSELAWHEWTSRLRQKNSHLRILLLRTDGKLGDAIVGLGFVKALLSQLPNNVELHVLGPASFFELYCWPRLHFHIWPMKLSERVQTCRHLSLFHFDLIVDTSTVVRWQDILSWHLLRGRFYLGFNKESYQKFHKSHSLTDDRSMYLHFQSLLELMGLPQVEVLPTKPFTNVERPAKSGNKYILFNAYGGAHRRSFDLNWQLNFLRKLEEYFKFHTDTSPGISIQLLWSKETFSTANQVVKSLDSSQIQLAKQTSSLEELANVVNQAFFIVTPDTSIFHLARSYQKPVLVFFRNDPGNMNLWGPLQGESYCFVAVNPKASSQKEESLSDFPIEIAQEHFDRVYTFAKLSAS